MKEIFDPVRKFLLIIGNARSGTTLLGAALDSHPAVILANEMEASVNLWRDMDRHSILDHTFQKAVFDHENGRPSEGYLFPVGTSPLDKSEIHVIGDKIHNPSILHLFGNYKLIPSLSDRLALPLYFIHAIRNPFDVIATMHHRSTAPVSNRISWYFMHSEAAEGILERVSEGFFLHTYHEELLEDTEAELGKICRFLDLAPDVSHSTEFRKILFPQPRVTRNTIHWNRKEIDAVYKGIDRYSFLRKYADPRFAPHC